jgi:hypothetical protein
MNPPTVPSVNWLEASQQLREVIGSSILPPGGVESHSGMVVKKRAEMVIK